MFERGAMAGRAGFELGRHGRLLQVVPGSRWSALKRVPRHSVYGEIARVQPSRKLLSNKWELGAPLLAGRRRRLHHVSKTSVESRGAPRTAADNSKPASRWDLNSYRQKSRAINKLERRTLRIRIPASPPVKLFHPLDLPPETLPVSPRSPNLQAAEPETAPPVVDPETVAGLLQQSIAASSVPGAEARSPSSELH